MTNSPLTIWCNAKLDGSALAKLEKGVRGHRLMFSTQLASSNLVAGAADPTLAQADVALGQPDPEMLMTSSGLRWAQLTSAGYTRYDTAAIRSALQSRGAALTNSSAVYAEPCAEHLLAFMLGQARQLPQSVATQKSDRAWPAMLRRSQSRLLLNQRVVMLGFGAIGRRLAELLAPFQMQISAIRRQSGSLGGVTFVAEADAQTLLENADHVINILPENAETLGFCHAGRFAAMKPGAVFYNVGRGTTVDQNALLAGLIDGTLGGAYLDVTDPEPLPHDHPLWSAPNCWITPHSAGGHADEQERLVAHFLDNLTRFLGREELVDRVI